MALCLTDSLTRRFEKARSTFLDAFAKPRKLGKTFSGFAQARLRHGAQVLEIAQNRLRLLVMNTAHRAGLWKIDGWVVLYCDGSRAKAPRSSANQRHLGLNGRYGQIPQAWITTLMHISGLTWGWIVDRGDSAERTHLKQMIPWLPPHSLLVADAGFTGFDLWTAILGARQHFLVRVGSNVRLIAKLADDAGFKARIRPGTNIVCLWRKQGRDKTAPIVLRLIVANNGRHPVYLVTSVLDSQRLSDARATEFYARRWGIELWFRSLKQTMGANRLCSQNPDQAKIELSFAAMARAVLGLVHLRALIKAGKSPYAGSCAAALAVVRAAIDRQSPASGQPRGLFHQLARALKDTYKRKGSKASRNYPVQKKYEKTGPPQIHDATPQEQALYKQLKDKYSPLAFTA